MSLPRTEIPIRTDFWDVNCPGYMELLKDAAPPNLSKEENVLALLGRGFEAVSYYGANIFTDVVAVAIETSDVIAKLTGRFQLAVDQARTMNEFKIYVELQKGEDPSNFEDRAANLAGRIHHEISCRSSEFRNYVPKDKQIPDVIFCEHGTAPYFSRIGKQRYIANR